MRQINILLAIIQTLLAIGMIIIVAIQQTKNEGLGGTIGGQVSSSFKGKPGFEERLNEWTKTIGMSFFAVSILVAITMNR